MEEEDPLSFVPSKQRMPIPDDDEDDSKKRVVKTKRYQRKWSAEENLQILDYLRDTVKMGFLIEKPNANEYYKLMIEKTKLNCSPSILRHKVRNFNTNYRATLKWRRDIGQGILISDGQKKYEEALQSRYPYFQHHEDIWGSQVNVHAPFTSSTDRIGESRVTDFDSQTTNTFTESADTIIPEASTIVFKKEVSDYRGFEESGVNTYENLSESESQTSGTFSTTTSSKAKSSFPISPPRAATPRDTCAEISMLRLKTSQDKLNFQKEQLEAETSRFMASHQLEREKFEFEKIARQQQFELQKIELENRKLELETQKLKWEIQHRKLANPVESFLENRLSP